MALDESLNLVPEEGISDPNGGVEVSDPGSLSPYSDPQLEVMASLATFAGANSADPSMQLSKFNEIVELSKATIDVGNENLLRSSIIEAESSKTVAALNIFLQESLTERTADIAELEAAVSAIPDVDRMTNTPGNMESAAIDRIEEFAMSHPDQAALIFLNAQHEASGGSLVGTLRDQLERSIILRQEADKVANEVKEQSLGADIFDIMARFIPLNKLTSVDNIYESNFLFFSGDKLAEAKNQLFNIPRSEFDEKIPQIFDKMRVESGIFSENKQLLLENLTQLRTINESDVALENFFDFLDFTSFTPVLRAGKSLSMGTIVKLGRNRELSKELTEARLKEVDEAAFIDDIEGTSDAKALTGENQRVQLETAEDAMPSALQADTPTVHGTVGFTGALHRSLEAGKKAIANVRAILNDTPRLTKAELEDALELAKAEQMKLYGEGAVLDFKVIPKQEVSPGVFTEMFSMILGRASGLGYVDQAGAIAAAKRKGILLPDISTQGVKAAEKKVKQANTNKNKVDAELEGEIDKINNSRRKPENKVKAIEKATDKAERAREAVVKADSALTNELGKLAKNQTLVDRVIKQGDNIQGHTLQDVDNFWFINVKSSLNESKYLHNIFEEGRTTGFAINNYIRSPSSFLPDILQRRAVDSVFTRGSIERLVKPLIANIRGISRSQRARVGAVAKQGNIEKQWFDASEFTRRYVDLHDGRMPTEGELLSYYALKDINDFEYVLTNHHLYTERASQGYFTGKVESPNGINIGVRNMKEIEHIDDINNAIILDVSNNKTLLGRSVGLDNLKKRMKEEGLKLIKVDDTVPHNGKPVNHILVRKGDLFTKDLEYRQLDYVAGGHRLYKGKFFGKQASIGESTGGAKYIENPLTHIVGPTEGTVAEWVGRMENARLAYLRWSKGTIDLDEANKIMGDAGISPTGKRADGVSEWAKMLDDGTINDNPFQVTFDKEAPKLHRETLLGKDGDEVYDLTFNKTGSLPYLEQQGIPYYRKKKGNILKDPQEETAELVDPFVAATRAVENASNLAAWTNYRVNSVQRWLNEFGHLLPKSQGLSPTQRFWQSKNIESSTTIPASTADQAQLLRSAIQRQLGTQSKFGSRVRTALRNLGKWVEADGKRTALPTRIYNLMDKDPISAIKGFSFDLKLGLFDPSQLIIQTQTIAALWSLDPLKAGKFMFDAPLMRYALVNQTDEMLNFIAKRSAMDTDEFKSMIRSMRESGISDINGELVMLDHHATSAISAPGTVAANIRDMGRIPFFEAERWNRIYAWRKAWEDMRSGKRTAGQDQVGAVGGEGKALSIEEILTSEGRAELARRTDQFTMNMTSASAAFWQKGVWSIPTQFLSYQARMFENILPVIGNKQWTNSEKFRLFAGQVFLYGAVGVPFGRYALDTILTETGAEFDPDSLADQTAYRAMVGGFWDSMLYAVTTGELDVAFSERASVGKAFEDFIGKINGSGFETQNIVQLIGGAPFSVLGDVASDAYDVIKTVMITLASETGSVTELDPMLITRLTDNASSMSRMHKLFYAYHYGEYISSETGKVLARNTPIESVAIALGIQLRDLADANFANSLMTNRRDYLKAEGKIIGRLRLEAERLWRDGNKREWELKQREIMMRTQVYNSRDRLEINKRSMGSRDWRSYVERTVDQFTNKLGTHTNNRIAAPLPAPNTSRN
tara:strand:- start:196 stop:5232 length:5037 start_codon:yes stop_codon:yes gene_type:complete